MASGETCPPGRLKGYVRHAMQDNSTNALDRRFPALSIPRLSLGCFPTPVQELDSIGRPGSVRLWCKREDLAGKLYGGNKVRKLEYILAALPSSDRAVITMGGSGSHHMLATAIYAKHLGLGFYGIFFPQPETPQVRRNFIALQELSHKLWMVPNRRRIAKGILRAWHYFHSKGEPFPHLVAPGGSDPLGTLGWVAGGLEIAQQVQAGEIPEPGQIFVALGTMGTAAGLALGLALAGMNTRVMAVRVVEWPLTTMAATMGLARRTLSMLSQHGLRLEGNLPPLRLDVLHGFAGPGYGAWTPGAGEAARLVEQAHGISLETTYTGKAMAACLDWIRQRRTGREVMFIDTVNSRPMDAIISPAGSAP